MQKIKWRILSTRPLPQAVVREAAAAGFWIEERSFIHIEPEINGEGEARITELFQKPIAAVFTSANAVAAVGPHVAFPNRWVLYCIGNATAGAASQVFQKPLAATAPDAAALAAAIIKRGETTVHFFCGNIRRDALPDALRRAGIGVEEHVVYRTSETPSTIETAYDGILFYSPSAVRSFFSLNALNERTQVFAIGGTTAEAIGQHTANPVVVAANAGKNDLVYHMMRHFRLHEKETK